VALDVWLLGLLLLLTIGSFVYVFGLKKLPWPPATSRPASLRCSWPFICLSPFSSRSAS